MKRFIIHNNVFVRFSGLYFLGLGLFLAAWFLGFYLFPEGSLRGTSLASKLAGSDIGLSVGKELTRILLVNLLMGSVIILFNLSFRINNLPLGYLIPPIWFLLYGLILGSNSFTFAMDGKMAPSLAVLGRSGLYELAAYTLIAVSTYNISRFQIKRLFVTNPEKINKPIVFGPQQVAGLGIAFMVLIFSNIKEVIMLLNHG